MTALPTMFGCASVEVPNARKLGYRRGHRAAADDDQEFRTPTGYRGAAAKLSTFSSVSPSMCNVGKRFASKAKAHTMETRTTAIEIERRRVAPSARAGDFGCALAASVGRSAIKPTAISLAACSGHRLAGMLEMLRARLSVASEFGNLASLSASFHGSLPVRAKTESTLSDMPLASVPMHAKRKSLNPERRKAKASALGMTYSYHEMWGDPAASSGKAPTGLDPRLHTQHGVLDNASTVAQQ